MILTTTPTIEGANIRKYLGIVTGEVIEGTSISKDFAAGITNVFGGRPESFERDLEKARKQAITEMKRQAESKNANAVVGIHLEYEFLGSNNGMIMVSAIGTAVFIDSSGNTNNNNHIVREQSNKQQNTAHHQPREQSEKQQKTGDNENRLQSNKKTEKKSEPLSVPDKTIRKLQNKTGADFSECRKALIEANGDFNKALLSLGFDKTAHTIKKLHDKTYKPMEQCEEAVRQANGSYKKALQILYPEDELEEAYNRFLFGDDDWDD